MNLLIYSLVNPWPPMAVSGGNSPPGGSFNLYVQSQNRVLTLQVESAKSDLHLAQLIRIKMPT